MGKTTLYHPVSLNVIRGAFEYCGFRLGRIRQQYSDTLLCHAEYTVAFEKTPKGFDRMSQDKRFVTLGECLPQEIAIDEIITAYAGKTKKLTTVVNFHTWLPRNDVRQSDAAKDHENLGTAAPPDDLRWLMDDSGLGQLEADAYVADQQAVEKQYGESDIPF